MPAATTSQEKKRKPVTSLPTPLFQQRPNLEDLQVDDTRTALEKSTARMRWLIFIGIAFLISFQVLASHFFFYRDSPRRFEDPTQGAVMWDDGIPHSKNPWPRTSWKTENFSTSVLEYEKYGPTDPGYLFYGVEAFNINKSAPIIMKDDGELIYQGRVPENASNFKVQFIDEEPYLTTWTGTIVGSVGQGYGNVHIYDRTYKEVYTFCDQIPPLVTLDDSVYPCYIDTHESQVTPRATLLVTAYNITRHDLSSVGSAANGWIVDCLFYEIDIKSGNVVFRWSSLEQVASIPITQSHKYTNLTSPVSGTSQGVAWDYFHINSVSILDDGYLVNARHTWSFYKLSRSGAVEWRVEGDPADGGDFTLEPDVSFKWQHNTRANRISASEVQITLFDNHNSNFLPASAASSGQILLVNEETRHVSLLGKLQNAADKVVSQSQGNYQSLNERDPTHAHAMIGYGSIPVIKEYDENGFQFYKGQFDSYNGTSDSYRAYRFEWEAYPYWNPRVYAELQDDGYVHIWSSWNGATEYDSWRILAGDDPSNLEVVAHGPREGFETEVALQTEEALYVQAIALRQDEELGRSDAVRVQHGQ